MVKKCKHCNKEFMLIGTKYELHKFVFCTDCIREMKETRIGREALKKRGVI